MTHLKNNTFKIMLKNYQVYMHLGFLAHEKIHRQNVSIDVEIGFEKKQMFADDVLDVFNYQIIIDTIEDLIQKPFHLQEFLIQSLIDALVEKINKLDDRILQNLNPQFLLIRTHKIEAYEKAQSIGVESIYYF
jgi:7,8-dihydroneopterin aldolase/epimerase/oxygenase